jgi:hypothetical protein
MSECIDGVGRQCSHHGRRDIQAGSQWPTPVILATWEAEVQRVMVRGHIRQKVSEIQSQPTAGRHPKLCEELRSGVLRF